MQKVRVLGKDESDPAHRRAWVGDVPTLFGERELKQHLFEVSGFTPFRALIRDGTGSQEGKRYAICHFWTQHHANLFKRHVRIRWPDGTHGHIKNANEILTVGQYRSGMVARPLPRPSCAPPPPPSSGVIRLRRPKPSVAAPVAAMAVDDVDVKSGNDASCGEDADLGATNNDGDLMHDDLGRVKEEVVDIVHACNPKSKSEALMACGFPPPKAPWPWRNKYGGAILAERRRLCKASRGLITLKGGGLECVGDAVVASKENVALFCLLAASHL